MTRDPKPIVFILLSLIVFGLLAYFGVRTLKHEVSLRHDQVQSLARMRTDLVRTAISGVLHERAAHLERLSLHLSLDEKTLNELRDKDPFVRDLFVLEKDRLLYPDERNLNQREAAWVAQIRPFVHDPSLLDSHSDRRGQRESNDQRSSNAGWFIVHGAQETQLIYWLRKDDKIIGYGLSYVEFLAAVIAACEFDFAPDYVVLSENERVLYQSAPEDLATRYQQETTLMSYPFANWRIDYFGVGAKTVVIYVWGGAFLLLLAAALSFVLWRVYRDYTAALRNARQQVNFVGQVSHELKTPLTNILLYAALLREALADDDHAADTRHVAVIESEGARLSRLIQNILTLTHAPKMHWQAINLPNLLTQIAEHFAPSLAARGLVLHLQLAGDCVLTSDIDRLTQILSNFVNNAEKYAATGKTVRRLCQSF